MRFSAIHKVASYLMIASAFAAVALSRELPPPLLVLTVACAVPSFFAEPSRFAFLRHRAWGWAWNLVTAAGFLWLTLHVLTHGEPLYDGVRFLCLLLVNKLWNRRASRDYLQAYVVSFLMLVAGAALSSELSYAVCFFAYVVFATWTLTLFHLRREMEENYLLKHSDGAQSERVEVERILNSRRIVGPAFLGATSAVSVAIFACAWMVFFTFPRFGFGFLVAKNRQGAATIGFSDHVDLGEYGLVKDNPQVVMRVELAHAPTVALHLRGVSFDRYSHGHWSRTPGPATPLRRWGGTYWFVGMDSKTRLTQARVRELIGGTLEQRVYLDPLDTPVLFGASQPIAYELPPSLTPTPVELEGRAAGEVHALERHVTNNGTPYQVERKAGLRYTVYSEVRMPPEALLAAVPDGGSAPELEPYLELPPDLPPRIGELARRVTAAAVGPYQKARQLEHYLQTSYRYTLDLKRDPRYEPLEDFLFVQKAGHCEYFASALAVMLRTVGVPTRSVNGFYAGEWNGYGKYLAVRQGDAHSWVEVWLDGIGWLTFDPTPIGPALTSNTGAWRTLEQVVDTVELAWFKYVIEYDLARQIEIVQGVRDWSQSVGRGPSLGTWAQAHRRALVGLGAALMAAAMLWSRRQFLVPARRARAAHAAATTAFSRAVRALERRGFARAPGETGRELSARVSGGGDAGAPAFAELVELYYAARFGGAPVPVAELERLAAQVAHPSSATRRAV
jgi:transglutaminase-like putative cysteine protease